MWATSDRFLRALRRSHDVVTLADVYREGERLIEGLPISGGSVTVDEGSSVRRTISFSVADTGLDPTDAEDLLAPFGTEVHVRSGVRFTEGDTETVPVGVFRLEDVGRGGWYSSLEVQGADRSRAVAEARFLTPWNTPAGIPVVQEISNLILSVLPNAEVFDLTFSEAVTTRATWDRDRWEAVESLASSIGAEVYFDPAGRAFIRPVPVISPDSQAVWEIDVDAEDGVLLDVATGLSREGVYNAVVAKGEPAGEAPPVLAIAYQSSGPLRWRPGFQIPRFYTSAMIQTVSQAEAAARTILARSLAYSRTIGPSVVPNPALDVGDVLGITLPDGVRALHIARSLQVPLTPGEMPIETRVNAEADTTTDPGSLE